MRDSFVFLAPVLLLAVVGLLGFVGCDLIFTLEEPPPPPEPPEPPDIQYVEPIVLDHLQPTPTNVVSAAFARAITTGDLLVVWIWYLTDLGHTVAGVSDSANNTYEPADDLIAGQGTLANARQQVWFAKNAQAGGGALLQLTVTFSGTVEEGGVGVFEYANASPTAPLVTASQQPGFGAQAASPAATTNEARLLFGTVVFAGAGTNDPVAEPRLLQEGNLAEDYLVAPLPQQIIATTTPPGAERDWIAQLVAFT